MALRGHLFMPTIYLQHPVHGSKVATVEAEAVYDESNGWTRYDPSPVNASEEVLTETPSEVYNEIVPPPPPESKSKKAK